MRQDLAPGDTAPQHERGPRPLPLFLDLVRRAGERDPELAARALKGLAAYQQAPRNEQRSPRPVVAKVGGASLKHCCGDGRPIVLVPSLINPPSILDLDSSTSLAEALGESGRVLLLDWGPAADRRDLDLGGHIAELLLPLLEGLGERAVLVGYCLGGTMSLAAANLLPVRGVVTLASPWRFSAYPEASRDVLRSLWLSSATGAQQLGILPIEVLQAAFWSIDPHRVVAKFARLADAPRSSEELSRFVTLEEWANSGEPLPLPAARELVEDLFGSDLPGSGGWVAGGEAISPPSAPTLHFTASRDGIVPSGTVAPGDCISCPAGHVGMVVGRSAPRHLHAPLREWLAHLGPHR